RAVAEGNGAGQPIEGAPPAPPASARASFEEWDSPNTFSGNGNAEPFSGGSDTADSLGSAALPPEETRSPIVSRGPSPQDPVHPKPTPSDSDRPSIAGAFSALLAGEQAPPARFSHPLPSVSDAAIEQVVHRVLARMTEESVRKIVLENAERIIREEIER